MLEKLNIYIKDNLESSEKKRKLDFSFKRCFVGANVCEEECLDVNSFIDDNKDENKFQSLLFKYIDDRGLKDSDVYNKVHIDRRLFSKIRSDINYHPSKETVILLGLSLGLSIDEFICLLDSASYSLPKNNYFDLIIRFCFLEKIYDLKKVNDLLDAYNCKLFNY